jgi:hypothetical protein
LNLAARLTLRPVKNWRAHRDYPCELITDQPDHPAEPCPPTCGVASATGPACLVAVAILDLVAAMPRQVGNPRSDSGHVVLYCVVDVTSTNRERYIQEFEMRFDVCASGAVSLILVLRDALVGPGAVLHTVTRRVGARQP